MSSTDLYFEVKYTPVYGSACEKCMYALCVDVMLRSHAQFISVTFTCAPVYLCMCVFVCVCIYVCVCACVHTAYAKLYCTCTCICRRQLNKRFQSTTTLRK